MSKLTVWFANTSSGDPGSVENCCEAWLSDEEIARANRFRQPTSRNQHVVGRGMARRLLGDTAVQPTDIRFGEAVHGKPFVVDPDEAKQPFNIAHTDGMVLCSVGHPIHQLVGVDVERLTRSTDRGLADRFFSSPEIEFLKTKNDDADYQNAFLRVWTLKESFIKAIGTGLQTPLADFAFEQIESACPQIRLLNPDLKSDLHWKFFSFTPKPGFVAALAVAHQNAEQSIDFEVKSFDELVD